MSNFTHPFGSDGNDVATGILILALNQLVGRRSLTKLDSWVSNGPLQRWMDIRQKRLTKDYFLSALDKISPDVNSITCSYSNSIQNPLQVELAEKFGKISSCENYNLFLCNSGAEANENALKLASLKQEKRK